MLLRTNWQATEMLKFKKKMLVRVSKVAILAVLTKLCSGYSKNIVYELHSHVLLLKYVYSLFQVDAYLTNLDLLLYRIQGTKLIMLDC